MRHHIAQNIGEFDNYPSIHHPDSQCNRTLTQFTEVNLSKHTGRVILPKFHPANILRYTVHNMPLHTIIVVMLQNRPQ